MQDAVGKLVTAAKSGKQDQVKAAFGDRPSLQGLPRRMAQEARLRLQRRGERVPPRHGLRPASAGRAPGSREVPDTFRRRYRE
jgi:hypothetical protein